VTEPTGQSGHEFPPTGRADVADVVLHEERLLTSTERVAVERVRISKRIVTTTRTIEVAVRAEQLVVTHEPLSTQESGPLVDDAATTAAGREVVLVLHEEVPDVTLRVVPVERVVVGKRSVPGEQTVSVELAAETAEVTTHDAT